MARTLAAGQRSQVWIADAITGDTKLLYETDQRLVEAPNWSKDGTKLFVNGDGLLWSLAVDGAPELEPVSFSGLPEINNDHVLSPDGRGIFMSADDGHIYRGELSGGHVDRITNDDGNWHFLHGITNDGSTLAYVELATFDQPGRLVLIPSAGGEVTRITTGDGHLDGPEWSHDDAWIYFNTESFTTAPGHAQLARVPSAGGTVERLTDDDTVDWFPHPDPGGDRGVYIAFPAGTLGHPADRPVELRIVDTSDWSTPIHRIALDGGQGTINVNSWAPDGRHFAYVAYPIN